MDQAASIKAMVVNSIEGLPYDNVTVSFFPASRTNRNHNKRDAEDLRLAGVSLDSRTALLAGAAMLFVTLIAVVRRVLATQDQ